MAHYLRQSQIKNYLSEIFKGEITDLKIGELGKGILGVGYALDFKVNGRPERKVLKTLFKNHLGQDHFSDRAQSLILAHSNYGNIESHVSSFDVCGVKNNGAIVSIGQAKEFFILMDEAQGDDYFNDLNRISRSGRLAPRDKKRVESLANYLIKLHGLKHKSDSLYKRKIRDTIGSGQSIMGILDMYPKKLKWTNDKEIVQLVKKGIDFWAKDRFKKHRLCQIHGDFHPGNIWFKKDNSFTLLDRARGSFGEAADDISSLTINYIFFSLIHFGEFDGPFKKLSDLFCQSYFKKTKDEEMREIIQPYFAFRTIVVCNPLFYSDSFYGGSNKANQVRRRMFNFANNILDKKEFDWGKINKYIS